MVKKKAPEKEVVEPKTQSGIDNGKVLSVAVPVVVGAVALPFIASAAALSTAVIGGIAGAAIGIGCLAGKRSGEEAGGEQ